MLAALAIALGAPPAFAFCRTTTCDPTTDANECSPDDDGCATDGSPLFWDEACATFSVQQDGSPLRGISFDTVDAIATEVFHSWTTAACNGGTPSIGIVPTGPVECDLPEYNTTVEVDGSVIPPGPNANVIMFRDDTWPYPGGNRVIGQTTITFNPETGQIFDVDIEINSVHLNITTTDDPDEVGSDLHSVLAHEVGHFFGLAHTNVHSASLSENYDRGDLSFRTLHEDDEAGVCAAYPPEPGWVPNACPEGTQPRHGFSPQCRGDVAASQGCAVAPGQRSRAQRGVALLVVVSALGSWIRRRRRASR